MMRAFAAPPAELDAAPRGRSWTPWWLAAYGAVLGGLLFVLAKDALPDDGLISLSYARNLADSGCWCLTRGIEANTATSMLNVVLLAGLLGLVGKPFVAAALLLCVCLAVTAVWLHRLGGRWASLLGVALLASSPLLASSIGLETFLACAVLVGLVWATTSARWNVAGLLIGAAILSRPDMAAAALAVLAVAALDHRVMLPPLRALAIGILATLPWFAWSWYHFGSALPETLAVKATVPGWGAHGEIYLWNAAPYYLDRWPAATGLTLTVLALGVLAFVLAVSQRQWPAVALGLGGLADLGAMIAAHAGPSPYYLGPAFAGLGLGAVLVAVRTRWAWPVVAVTVGAAGLLLVTWNGWTNGMAPLRVNWASNAEYARIVDGLPTEGVILSSGEIGALAYFGNDRGVIVIDPYLADPGRTAAFVDKYRAQHPGKLTELNYRNWHRPEPLHPAWLLNFGGQIGERGDWTTTGADGRQRAANLERNPE
jgi:hypothetical protein